MGYFKIKGLFSFCSFSQPPKLTASIYFLFLLLLSIAVWGFPFLVLFSISLSFVPSPSPFPFNSSSVQYVLLSKTMKQLCSQIYKIKLGLWTGFERIFNVFLEEWLGFSKRAASKRGGGERCNSEWQQFSHRLLPWIKRSFLNWDNFSVQVLKVTLWIPICENMV